MAMNRLRQLVGRANVKQTVGGAAAIISIAYLLSRLLGLLRDRLLIAHFGVGATLDAYMAAFSLPDLLFTLLVSGAFAVTFIPVFTSKLHQGEEKEAWEMTATLLNLLVIVTVLAAIIGSIFASPIVSVMAAGFHGSEHNLTVNLTRIMLLTPIFFAISSVFGSIQQAKGRFLIYAMASVLYNLGIIFGILVFSHHFGIYGVAWGVVLGTVLQALLQLGGLIGLGVRYKPILKLKLRSVHRVLWLMLPRAIDQGIDQVNFVIEKAIGSTLAVGSVTAYTLANNLKNVPLSLIGSAIATAVFPRLTANVADGKKEELANDVSRTARFILFLSLPSAAFVIVARGYIVRVLYGFGNVETANALGWFAGTIVFASLFFLVARIFFAYQDTRTPLIVSLFSIGINVYLSFTLSHHYGVSGLAMAGSTVDALETITLLAILQLRHIPIGLGRIINGSWRMLAAALVMGAALFELIHYVVPLYASDVGFLVIAPKFGLILGTAVVVYGGVCYLLRLQEGGWFVRRVRELLARPLGLN
jgi:putative peptidoglycan lipid II flippase